MIIYCWFIAAQSRGLHSLVNQPPVCAGRERGRILYKMADLMEVGLTSTMLTLWQTLSGVSGQA